MPRFAFSPIDSDPFAKPDATPAAVQYARELGGAPDAPGTVGEAFRQDLAGVPNRLMDAIGRVGTRFEDLGNVLMGNRLVIQTPDGPIDVTNDSMIDAGAELSGLVGGTGSLARRPANSLGVFAGSRAKTANLEQLARAKRFAANGASPAIIWKSTGWAQGPDGQWRFEIPDQTSKFDENKLKPWTVEQMGRSRELLRKDYGGLSDKEVVNIVEDEIGAATTLDKILDHPGLYAAYPELRKMRVERVEREDLGGYYDPEGDFVAMTPKGADVPHKRGDEGHSVLLHEIQHAIQTREGFGHGGSPNDPAIVEAGKKIKSAVKERMDELKSRIQDSPIVEEDLVGEYAGLVRLYGKIKDEDPGMVGYQALSGEVEARNVENRFGHTRGKIVASELMKLTPPIETEDTSRAIQWVRRPERWYKGASGK